MSNLTVDQKLEMSLDDIVRHSKVTNDTKGTKGTKGTKVTKGTKDTKSANSANTTQTVQMMPITKQQFCKLSEKANQSKQNKQKVKVCVNTSKNSFVKVIVRSLSDYGTSNNVNLSVDTF
jgi:hypothetical protein